MLICKKCGNQDHRQFRKNGRDKNGKQLLECLRCGKVTTSNADPGAPPLSRDCEYSFTDRGETAEVYFETRKRIITEKDLVALLNLDTDTWMIDRFVVGKSEGYRKERRVDWRVIDGKVIDGEVHDTGKLLIEPLFSVKVWLKRRTQEIRHRTVTSELIQGLEKFTPRYKRVRYPKVKGGLLFEIEMPDIHLGKLTWGEESGENSDLKTQTARVMDAVDNLLGYARHYPIEKILLPMGSDYFNADNQRNETTAGTPQQEDTRWRKTFRAGVHLAVALIDLCANIAPVHVLFIPGNHDHERSFYLGSVVQAWYRKCPNVQIDNLATSRKYFTYGVNLIGFSHGHSEKIDELPGLMPSEKPELWAASKYREWHVGHLHHKRDLIFKTSETGSVTVRFLRSLTPVDTWHYERGLVSAIKASEAFLWNKEDGLIAQFTYAAKPNAE